MKKSEAFELFKAKIMHDKKEWGVNIELLDKNNI